jgi:hypothetical protein
LDRPFQLSSARNDMRISTIRFVGDHYRAGPHEQSGC